MPKILYALDVFVSEYIKHMPLTFILTPAQFRIKIILPEILATERLC